MSPLLSVGVGASRESALSHPHLPLLFQVERALNMARFLFKWDFIQMLEAGEQTGPGCLLTGQAETPDGGCSPRDRTLPVPRRRVGVCSRVEEGPLHCVEAREGERLNLRTHNSGEYEACKGPSNL